MASRLLSMACLLLAGVALSRHPSLAQAAPAPQSQSSYTIQVNTRVVLTDVTVTGPHGEPVHGLPQSAFHIADDNKPQRIASFKEHAESGVAPPSFAQASAAGFASNQELLHPPPVLNVLLLDTTTIELEDQMFLAFQLRKFVDRLPPGVPVAVFLKNGPVCVLLQGFTADHAALLAAVRRALPRFAPPADPNAQDTQPLLQIADRIGLLPGRKNVLWFTGGSAALLRPDGVAATLDPGLRLIYDELERNRISVYPVDARGLTVAGSAVMLAQQSLMRELAQATGGRAIVNNNGLALAAASIVANDGSYYTLTYTPRDLQFDNRWHTVKVTVDPRSANGGNSDGGSEDGGYQLSYRRGYFADGANASGPQVQAPARRRLTGSGDAVEESTRSDPIIFQAQATPGSSGREGVSPVTPKRGSQVYTVHFLLPADAFQLQSAQGRAALSFVVASIALNEDGKTLAQVAQKITYTLKPGANSVRPGTLLSMDQQLALPRGDLDLFLVVHDLGSLRVGTLEMPLTVRK